MNIRIFHLLEGAKQAEGLTVIIDVFRAFTCECWMYAAGAEKVIAVGAVADAFALREKHPGWILAGERNGIMVEGFDYGNSPAAFEHADLKGKTVVHTTSAGVQGLTACRNADEIVTGALINAAAVARYIKERNPETVSLVAMGWNGIRETEEDELCAEYIASLLEDRPLADIEERALQLRFQEGKKFFDPAMQNVFPEQDFWLCVKPDLFDHVIRVQNHSGLFETEWTASDALH